MGAVLNKVTGEVRRPLAFWSKTLKPFEQKWSCYERELYACFSAIKHFRYFLGSRDFVLRTDHKPIVTKFHCDSLAASPRQARFIDYIAQFTNRVEHVSGNANIADALSRPYGSPQINSILSQVAAIDYLELEMQQCFDPEIVEMRNSNTSFLVLKEVPLAESGVHLLCDDSMRKLRLVIPTLMRLHVFCYFHNLGHPGIRGSVRLLIDVVVWNGIRKDYLARQCLQCCRSKVQHHTLALFQEISSPPTSRFTHAYVDLTGLLPPSNGYTYLMVAVCRFSRYFQAIPMEEITAEEFSFVSGWVSLFGSPSHFYCDRCSQSTSSSWKELISFLGAKLHHATSYYPQAQGIVERVNRTLKTALKASRSPSEWHDNLPWILLVLCNLSKEDMSRISPNEVVFGEPLRLPGAFFDSDNEGNVLETATTDYA